MSKNTQVTGMTTYAHTSPAAGIMSDSAVGSARLTRDGGTWYDITCTTSGAVAQN